jgi:hypothetical protein
MNVDPASFLSQLPKVYLENYVKDLDGNSQVGAEKTGAGCQQNVNAPDTSCKDQATTTNVMKFMAHASLNTIRVIVGGDMTVDVDRIPATITSITMDEGNQNAATWKKGKHSGVISGNFLSCLTPSLTDPTALSKIAFTADQNSSSKDLHFTMDLPSDVSSGTNITFIVTKSDKQGNKIRSTPFVFPIVNALPLLSNAIVNTIQGPRVGAGREVVMD